ncbi:MAG: gamma-glutamylcyclotransferase family protein [Halolamina sp.]
MDVFVYGTLTEPEQVAWVVDAYAFLGPAVLRGLHPVQASYPTLAPGGETGGRLLRTDDVDALDDYEGVDEDLYVRVSVPVAGDAAGIDDEVAVYVGDPVALGVDDVSWPTHDGAGSFAERVRAYLRRNDVRVVLE